MRPDECHKLNFADSDVNHISNFLRLHEEYLNFLLSKVIAEVLKMLLRIIKKCVKLSLYMKSSSVMLFSISAIRDFKSFYL